MSSTSFNEFVKQVKLHLELPKALISVAKDGKKFAKPNCNIDRYNWSKQDILNAYASVEEFFKDLPNKGYQDGAVLDFRFVHGSSTRVETQANLTFPSFSEPKTTETVEQKSEPMDNNQNYSPPSPSPAPPSAPAPAALGYTQVPMHEFINLKVLQERHEDLKDRHKRTEKERDNAESEVKKLKDDNHALQRKFDLLEDKHELHIEKIQREQKKFWESEEAKMLMQQAPQLAEALLSSFGNRNAQIGMGNPIAEFSEEKMQVVKMLEGTPENVVPIIYQVFNALLNVDGFYDSIQPMLAETQQQQTPAA